MTPTSRLIAAIFFALIEWFAYAMNDHKFDGYGFTIILIFYLIFIGPRKQ